MIWLLGRRRCRGLMLQSRFGSLLISHIMHLPTHHHHQPSCKSHHHHHHNPSHHHHHHHHQNHHASKSIWASLDFSYHHLAKPSNHSIWNPTLMDKVICQIIQLLFSVTYWFRQIATFFLFMWNKSFQEYVSTLVVSGCFRTKIVRFSLWVILLT